MKKTLFQLAWPIFIESMLFLMLGFIDTFMLSRYSDYAAGAIGATTQITHIINLLFVVISGGSSILLAQYLGAKKKEEVTKVMSAGLIVNLIIGVFISVFIFFRGDFLLSLINISEDLMPYSRIYLKIIGSFFFMQALMNTMGAFIRTHGHTKHTMYITILMNIINVIGDAAFIYGLFGFPIWGVKGVAIATMFSRSVAFIIISVYFYKIILKQYLHMKWFKLSKSTLSNIVRIGLPAAVENINYNFVSVTITGLIFTYLGQTHAIAHVYIAKIFFMAFIFSFAIAQANQILVGHKIGAGKLDEAYTECLSSFRKALIFACVAGVILFVFSKQLLGIFTSDPEILAIGTLALMIDAFLEPGRTFNLVLISGLRAAGDVHFPVVVGIITGWLFRIGVGFVFAILLNLGLAGFILGSLIEEWIRGGIMLRRWISKSWQRRIIAK